MSDADILEVDILEVDIFEIDIFEVDVPEVGYCSCLVHSSNRGETSSIIMLVTVFSLAKLFKAFFFVESAD